MGWAPSQTWTRLCPSSRAVVRLSRGVLVAFDHGERKPSRSACICTSTAGLRAAFGRAALARRGRVTAEGGRFPAAAYLLLHHAASPSGDCRQGLMHIVIRRDLSSSSVSVICYGRLTGWHLGCAAGGRDLCAESNQRNHRFCGRFQEPGDVLGGAQARSARAGGRRSPDCSCRAVGPSIKGRAGSCMLRRRLPLIANSAAAAVVATGIVPGAELGK